MAMVQIYPQNEWVNPHTEQYRVNGEQRNVHIQSF